MQNDPISVQNTDRLAALDALAILDTPPEQGFDDAVRLATRLCDAPIALISLVTADRQWFKARINFPSCETDLDRSVCKFVLDEPDLLVIPDLTADERTRDNPLVTGEPFIRFYAGAPLRTAAGYVLGSLCIIDTAPRPAGLTAEQAVDLRALARQVTDLLELRRSAAAERVSQAGAVADAARLEAMIATQQLVASAGADLDTIFQAITLGALRVVDAATGAVIELREGDELVYRTTAGSSSVHQGIRLPLRDTLSGRALLEETMLHCPDTQADPEFNHALARKLGIRCLIAVPVFRQGMPIGILKVQSGQPNSFSARDILMAQMLAGLVASGLGEVAEAQTRQALRDAESRYKAIFDSATEFAIVAADPQARITDWNTGAERILGWQAGDVRGQPLDVFFTPEDQERAIPEREQREAVQLGAAEDERWHQRRNGERFWAVGRMMALRHEDDGIRGYLKILQDRTRERRREQRIDLIARASEALLSADDPAGALLPILMDGAEALGFDQSYTWDVLPDGKHLRLTHSVGVDEASQQALATVSLDVPLCGIVAQSGDPLVLSSLQAGTTQRYAIARDAGIDAYAGYPVVAGGAVVGVISFATMDEPRFDAEALTFFATVTRFLSIARARRDATHALAVSNARSRLAEEGGQIGTFEIDLGTDILTVSDEMCRVFGVPAAPSYPASVFEDCFDRSYASAASTIAERHEGNFDPKVEYRIRRADDGRLRWIARNGEFVRGADGRALRMFGTVQDVTDRRRMQGQQAALIRLGDRLRGTTSTVEVVTAAAEVLGETLEVSRAGFAQVDVRRGCFSVEHDWTAPSMPSMVGEHDLSTFTATTDRLASGAPLVVADIATAAPLEADRAGYDAVGVSSLIKVPLLESGSLTGLLYAHQSQPRSWMPDEVEFAQAVADRTYAALVKVRAEAEQHLLNGELSHRLKNTLSMVLSISNLSLRSVADREPVEAFERRVRALATAHDVLLRRSFTGAPVTEVVERVLHGTGQADRFDLTGPEITFGAQAALSLSLLLHELATNASKYGALSNSTGRVALTWDINGAADDRVVVMEWRERGGPSVSPPSRKGFGSRIIRAGLVGAGGVQLDYPSAGFEATMRAPLARIGSQ